MMDVLHTVATWAVAAIGTAVLVLAAIVLWWKVLDRLFKDLGLFPLFKEFAMYWWEKKRQEQRVIPPMEGPQPNPRRSLD